MSRSWFVLVGIAALGTACSSSVIDGSSTSGSGGAETSSTTATTGAGASGPVSSSTSSSSAASSSSSTSGAGTGGGDAGTCSDPSNPMFGSCIVPFLKGCWAPDLAGTCTDTNGVVAWSDGSKYVSQGSAPGLYAPGDTAPCIAMVFAAASITATKSAQMLRFDTASGAQIATITCPDGSSFTATDAQVTAFNVCLGLNCP
jgi:hypothetical protein